MSFRVTQDESEKFFEWKVSFLVAQDESEKSFEWKVSFRVAQDDSEKFFKWSLKRLGVKSVGLNGLKWLSGLKCKCN